MSATSHHSTPLVLGSSRAFARIAWRSARATALKQASTLWWSLSPLHLQVEVQARALAQRTEEMRHQLGRQVADPLARELALEHEVRAAGKSSAALASASSIGRMKP